MISITSKFFNALARRPAILPTFVYLLSNLFFNSCLSLIQLFFKSTIGSVWSHVSPIDLMVDFLFFFYFLIIITWMELEGNWTWEGKIAFLKCKAPIVDCTVNEEYVTGILLDATSLLESITANVLPSFLLKWYYQSILKSILIRKKKKIIIKFVTSMKKDGRMIKEYEIAFLKKKKVLKNMRIAIFCERRWTKISISFVF